MSALSREEALALVDNVVGEVVVLGIGSEPGVLQPERLYRVENRSMTHPFIQWVGESNLLAGLDPVGQVPLRIDGPAEDLQPAGRTPRDRVWRMK